MVLPHVAGSANSVVDISDTFKLRELQTILYYMDIPGLNLTRQDKPYVHGNAVDPTSQFVVAFDRGMDVIRTYAVGWDERLTELGTISTDTGVRPRHGVFVKGDQPRENKDTDISVYAGRIVEQSMGVRSGVS